MEGSPPALARKISLEIKADKDEMSAWRLSGDDWRDVALRRVHHTARATVFNTPKTRQVDKLFDDTLGIPRVSDSWVSRFTEGVSPCEALDASLALRGSIAHRQERDRILLKKDVSRFYQLVADLVDCTELIVRDHLDAFGANLVNPAAPVPDRGPAILCP